MQALVRSVDIRRCAVGLTDVGLELGKDLLGPVRELGDFIRAQRTQAQISLRALADKAGVSNPYLSQVERGLRRPSAVILTQIADGLSISAETLLAKAGILRPHDTGSAVLDAIRADARLTERQKSSLAEIYRAFVGTVQNADAAPDDAAPDDAAPFPVTDPDQQDDRPAARIKERT
jgi:transcriptional regulator with XRE-family HTH domain